jgi:RNA polymerase sigma factor (sigma-70 family)
VEPDAAYRVYAYCFNRTGSWSMAEDLTSVVFLEAWRRRRHVRFSGDSVLPWLLAVANNATLNAQRTLRRHRRLLVKLPPAGEEPDIAEAAVRRVDTERAAAHLLVHYAAVTNTTEARCSTVASTAGGDRCTTISDAGRPGSRARVDHALSVCGDLAAGQRNRQIAQALGISTRTVDHHLRTMLRRGGAESRSELVARCYAAGY